jgi:hypothetical protein
MVSSRNAFGVAALGAVDLLAAFLLGLVHAVPLWTVDTSTAAMPNTREVTTLWTVCTQQPGQVAVCHPLAGFVSNDVLAARIVMALCTALVAGTLAVPLLGRVAVMEGAARAARVVAALVCAGVAIFTVAHGSPAVGAASRSPSTSGTPQTRVDTIVFAAVALLLHAMAALEWHRAYHGTFGHLVTSTRVTCLDPDVAVPGGGQQSHAAPLAHMLNPADSHGSANPITTLLPEGDVVRRTAANIVLGASWATLTAGTGYCLVAVNGAVFMGLLATATLVNVTASFFTEHARVTVSKRRRPHPQPTVEAGDEAAAIAVQMGRDEEDEATITVTYHSPLVPLLQQDVIIPAGSIDGIGYDAHFGRLAVLMSHSKSLVHAFPVASKEAGMGVAEHIVATLGLPGSLAVAFNE